MNQIAKQKIRACTCIVLATAVAIAFNGRAQAEEPMALDSYTCADFLADTKNPADGGKLLKSLMVIYWATGYAAAHDKTAARADIDALRITDNALVANYSVTYIGDEFVPGDKGKIVPPKFELFLKGNSFLVVKEKELVYVATLHQLSSGLIIVQIRPAKSLTYVYLLFQQRTSGFELRQIDCGSLETSYGVCDPKTQESLFIIAAATPTGSDSAKTSLVAERKAN